MRHTPKAKNQVRKLSFQVSFTADATRIAIPTQNASCCSVGRNTRRTQRVTRSVGRVQRVTILNVKPTWRESRAWLVPRLRVNE